MSNEEHKTVVSENKNIVLIDWELIKFCFLLVTSYIYLLCTFISHTHEFVGASTRARARAHTQSCIHTHIHIYRVYIHAVLYFDLPLFYVANLVLQNFHVTCQVAFSPCWPSIDKRKLEKKQKTEKLFLYEINFYSNREIINRELAVLLGRDYSSGLPWKLSYLFLSLSITPSPLLPVPNNPYGFCGR